MSALVTMIDCGSLLRSKDKYLSTHPFSSSASPFWVMGVVGAYLSANILKQSYLGQVNVQYRYLVHESLL